ncbi:MAG TPA: hypothetical protein VGI61_13055 [Parafilimonas sp.]
MKKIAAILLLVLLLFNFIGYRFLFDALQQKANKQLVAKIDKSDYDESNLITVKISLSMPYLTNWNDFKRTDGEITLNGKIYHYVKEKVYNGELILMCLPDEQKMNLQTAKNDFFKTQNDLQNNTSKNSGENSHVVKFSISDYIKTENAVNAFAANNNLISPVDSYFAHLQQGENLIPEQPPQA